MSSRFRLHSLGPVVVSLVLGCGDSRDLDATPLPDDETAREAIDAAMANWRADRPTGKIESRSPRIQVNDSFRKAGQGLESHEILGVTRAERSLTFVVKVKLTHPDDVQTVRFVLLGVDPVLVFRQEDYDLMSHWEHKMEPEPAEPTS